MRRASVGVGSNIAEGFERGTRKQQIECCYIAKGSAGELRSQIVMAHDAGLLDEQAFEWLHTTAERLSRQIHAYIEHLKQTQRTMRGPKFAESQQTSERARTPLPGEAH